MYQDKTLIVVLSMHRSGSSLTAHVLERLGMSLGPFQLLGATPYNPYGHFEAVPIYELDRRLQRLVFGFTEDLPESREVFERFCQSEGRWPAGVQIPPEMYHEGHELIEQLLASGRISGFKDPRVPLLWPFWSRVLAEFRGLRVVPLFVLRSPHEVAMSIFRRSQGLFAYGDVLEATAVHLSRMWSIWKTSAERRVLVRFDPRFYEHDLARAAAVGGLPWSAEVFRATYDAKCKHHEPVMVTHRSQALFERFVGRSGQQLTAEHLSRVERDAALREQVLRNHLHRYHETLAGFQVDIDYFRRLLVDHDAEMSQLRRMLAEEKQRAEILEGELKRIYSTRTWQIRNRLLQRLGFRVENCLDKLPPRSPRDATADSTSPSARHTSPHSTAADTQSGQDNSTAAASSTSTATPSHHPSSAPQERNHRAA